MLSLLAADERGAGIGTPLGLPSLGDTVVPRPGVHRLGPRRLPMWCLTEDVQVTRPTSAPATPRGKPCGVWDGLSRWNTRICGAG
ncbi:hypothetical protein [Streptomyces sp. KL116D]|uniref:hypothetical protein n=1 Tax=Streptomyces sp. KL116D TaxID=3045152 RepID=UPI00355802A6